MQQINLDPKIDWSKPFWGKKYGPKIDRNFFLFDQKFLDPKIFWDLQILD